MARTPSKEPTDGELEILKILWAIGPAGLGQIHEALRTRKDVALTTVATVLKMMLAKNLVERTDGPRGYLWSACLSRKSAVSGLVGKLVQHVFDGSAPAGGSSRRRWPAQRKGAAGASRGPEISA